MKTTVLFIASLRGKFILKSPTNLPSSPPWVSLEIIILPSHRRKHPRQWRMLWGYLFFNMTRTYSALDTLVRQQNEKLKIRHVNSSHRMLCIYNLDFFFFKFLGIYFDCSFTVIWKKKIQIFFFLTIYV